MTSQVELLRELQEYYNKELTATQARVYLRQFETVDPHELKQAIDHWIREQKWFPRVNELFEYIKELGNRNTQMSYDDHRWNMWKANDAWNKVWKGEMDEAALKKWPMLFDAPPSEQGLEPLGEWWKE